jgi:hypothetical protein
MCNDYRLHVGAGTIADDFSNIKIKIRFPEGTPNIEPRDDIKITDTAPTSELSMATVRRVSLFSAGGAGLGRTAGRSTTFARRTASSRLALA